MKDIPWFTLIFLLIINFGISWWNAYACGKTWVETKQIGGWQRFMNWMGAIMSASGFTWCYLIILLLGAYYVQPVFLKPGQHPVLTGQSIEMGFSLGYLIIIPGVIFSGMMIWLDSLVQAWRRRDLPSMGVAAWNTYAQVHNTYEAYSGIRGAFGSVSDFFKGGDSKDDSKGAAMLIVILLLVLAIFGGILTTWGIVSHFAGTEPLPQPKHAYARR